MYEHIKTADIWEPYFRRAIELAFVEARFKWDQTARSLETWLNDLLNHPIPENWPDELARFARYTAFYGVEIMPESLAELSKLIESRAKGTGAFAPNSRGSDKHASNEANSSSPISLLSQDEPPAPADGEEFFDQKLAVARQQLDAMEQALLALGDRLDAVEIDETVDVEDDVDHSETAIWTYNDALESARDAWLRDDLSGDANERLLMLHTPVSFGLPMFTDDEQAARARRQESEIGERLRARNITMDRIVLGMQAAEVAGTGASIALGGHLLLTAAKRGGRWAVVKTIAVAGAVAAGEQAGEAGLHAAGVSDQTIRGIRLAAAVVTLVLLLRRGRLQPTSKSEAAASAAADQNLPSAARQYWTKSIEFMGKKVYQRDDLIDLAKKDVDEGLTNLERMRNGFAPIGPDDKPINLHHLIQTEDGALAEITQTMHQQQGRVMHINPRGSGTAIDRSTFDRFRAQYWTQRAKDFVGLSE